MCFAFFFNYKVSLFWQVEYRYKKTAISQKVETTPSSPVSSNSFFHLWESCNQHYSTSSMYQTRPRLWSFDLNWYFSRANKNICVFSLTLTTERATHLRHNSRDESFCEVQCIENQEDVEFAKYTQLCFWFQICTNTKSYAMHRKSVRCCNCKIDPNVVRCCMHGITAKRIEMSIVKYLWKWNYWHPVDICPTQKCSMLLLFS